jgi:hypothetical protein
MSSISIRDLSHSTELDQHAMGEVRGGYALGPDVKVNLNVNQQIFQVQEIGVNVLNNNGTIGAGFVGPNIDLNASLKAQNTAIFPKFV